MFTMPVHNKLTPTTWQLSLDETFYGSREIQVRHSCLPVVTSLLVNVNIRPTERSWPSFCLLFIPFHIKLHACGTVYSASV